MNAVARHWDIVLEALADEKAKTRQLWDTDATAFLPAAVEIVERPVSPTARWTTRVLLVGLLTTILWLIFGEVDIVASAPGKLIPADNVKLIQPAESGIVRAILVRDGQKVRKGQVLVELDPTVSTADTVQAEKALETALLDAARARAILSALDGHGLVLHAPPWTSADVYATQVALARSQFAQIEASASTHAADVSATQAARSEALIQAAKLTETLPLLDEQIAANEKLLAKGFVSKLKVIEMRRQRLAAARDRDAALQTARKAEAQIAGARGSGAQARADARTKILDDLAKADSDAKLRSEELTKAHQHSSLQRLASPVDGTVSQLTIHTIGGVVEAAKPIMAIVPSASRLELEARVLNRDIGSVRLGQSVSIKVEAFPFTKFGVVQGKVSSLGPDAIEDDKLGPLFPARIQINQAGMDGAKHLVLAPGMVATADIATGRRSILEFLLSPMEVTVSQAAHEN